MPGAVAHATARADGGVGGGVADAKTRADLQHADKRPATCAEELDAEPPLHCDDCTNHTMHTMKVKR